MDDMNCIGLIVDFLYMCIYCCRFIICLFMFIFCFKLMCLKLIWSKFLLILFFNVCVFFNNFGWKKIIFVLVILFFIFCWRVWLFSKVFNLMIGNVFLYFWCFDLFVFCIFISLCLFCLKEKLINLLDLCLGYKL